MSSFMSVRERPSLLKDYRQRSSHDVSDDDDEFLDESSDSEVSDAKEDDEQLPAPYRGNARTLIPGQDSYLRPPMKKKPVKHRGVYIRMEENHVSVPPKKRGDVWCLMELDGSSIQPMNGIGIQSASENGNTTPLNETKNEEQVVDKPEVPTESQEEKPTGPNDLQNGNEIEKAEDIPEAKEIEEMDIEQDQKEGSEPKALAGNGEVEDHAGSEPAGSSEPEQVVVENAGQGDHGGLEAEECVAGPSPKPILHLDNAEKSNLVKPIGPQRGNFQFKDMPSSLLMDAIVAHAEVVEAPSKPPAPATPKKRKRRKRLFTKKPAKPKNPNAPPRQRGRPRKALAVVEVVEEEVIEEEDPNAPQGQLYCFCREERDGEKMVKCSNVACPIDGGWFHVKCVKLRGRYTRPEVDWYCHFCRRDPESPGVMRSTRSIQNQLAGLCYDEVARRIKTMLEIYFRL